MSFAGLIGTVPLLIIAVIIAVVVIVVISVSKSKTNPTNNNMNYPPQQPVIPEQENEIITAPVEEIAKVPFERKYLLTKNEYYFYKELKRIADKYNLVVLSKIRFADIVQVKNSEIESKSEWYSNFSKIKSRHIDFALANPDNLYVLLVIELDDNSHYSEAAKSRDEFINSVLEKCGYKLIRTKGPNNLEERIAELLELNKDNVQNQDF